MPSKSVMKVAISTAFAAIVLRKIIRDSRKYGGIRNAFRSFFYGHETFPVVKGYIPIIGHLIGLLANSDRIFDWQTENMLPHNGTPVCLRQPGNRVILLSDPRHVKWAWADKFESAERCRGGLGDLLTDMFGRGIFNSDGEQWKKHRKIGSRLFSMRHLKYRMFEDFDHYSQQLMTKLKQLHDLNPSEPIDIQDMFLRLTMDGFFSSSFGVASDNVECAPNPNEFSHHFDTMGRLTAERLYERPFWKWEKMMGGAREKLATKCRAFIRNAAEVMVNDRMDVPLDERTDLMSLFLKEQKLSGGLSKEDIIDMCLNFIIAGRDTTALTMCWTLIELAKNPEILKKVTDELRSIDKLTFDTVSKFVYTEKVLLEAGRMHPLVPSMSRVAIEDISLPGNDDWVIRKGDLMMVCNYVMGRAPHVWDDPMRFDPERFTDGLNTFDPSQYTNFNLGNRICLGRHVALLEMKVTFWYFFRSFDFKIDTDVLENVTYEKSIVLEIADGLPVHVLPRA